MAILAGMPAAGPPAYSWSTVASPGLVLGRLARDPALDRSAIDAEGVVLVRCTSCGGTVQWAVCVIHLKHALCSLVCGSLSCL